MKFLLMLLLIAQSFCAISDPTDLNPGDIAIIGFNFTDPDEFSFITFVDLDPGTVVYFTDCGWKNDNSFRTGEGLITYTVPASGLDANEVITYGVDAGFITVGVSGFFGLSATDGDQILVFQGSFTSPEFIFALNSNGSSWQTNSVDNNSSSLPPGLTNGLNAVAVNEVDNGNYNCFLEEGDQEDILAEISNSSNWIGSNTARMTFPSVCFDDDLPIELISFGVTSSNNYNLLNLIICNEENVLMYELQRSLDGISYESIVTIYPRNNKECNSYSFADQFLESCYYRLKEISINGEVLFYKSIFSLRSLDIISYCIYDVNGKVEYVSNDSVKSENVILSKIELLENGFYLVKIITSEGAVIRKVLKE